MHEFCHVLLGVLAKLQKVTITFVVFVCLSVRVEQLDFHRKDLHENLYLMIFCKSVDRIQVCVCSGFHRHVNELCVLL
jgi:hypothetical protein